MNILHIAPLSMRKSSGLTYSVPNFVNAQNRIEGTKADLLISLRTKEKNNKYYYMYDFKNNKNLANFLLNYDIVIFHSTYIYNHIKIASILKENHIPYVIVPRGGFTRESKNIKKLKKIIGDKLVFKSFFESPNAIQFLTENEKKQSVHKVDFNFVLPNGIKIPNIELKKISNHKLNIVYVGRMDAYTKGLDILIKAVTLIKSELYKSNVVIKLYGPDVRNSKKPLKEAISKHDMQKILQIKDPVYNDGKIDVLLDSDAFIQSSRFEGLSMGILEALSYGLPCILTPGTNLSREVKSNGAGIEVQLNSESIAKGILNLIELLKNGEKFSNNARKLAKKYSWDTIANQSIEIYNEIIEEGREDNATL